MDRRLSIPLSEEQYTKLCDLIPWGVRSKIFSTLVNDLLTILEGPHGDAILGAILKGEVKTRHILHNGLSGTSEQIGRAA